MSTTSTTSILLGKLKPEGFSTVILEMAHETLHKSERRTATARKVRETEAEAIAFVIGKAVGLKTDNTSDDRLHLYHGNASKVVESLEVIQRSSAVILTGLEHSIAKAITTNTEFAEVA